MFELAFCGPNIFSLAPICVYNHKSFEIFIIFFASWPFILMLPLPAKEMSRALARLISRFCTTVCMRSMQPNVNFDKCKIIVFGR